MVIKISWCLVIEKMEFKFLLASMKTLTNFKDPYGNPLQNVCCGIPEATCDSVNCSVSRR
jgi:hypothetical protein